MGMFAGMAVYLAACAVLCGIAFLIGGYTAVAITMAAITVGAVVYGVYSNHKN